MLIVCFLLSVVWLSGLRSVPNCRGRHDFGSRSGQLGLLVFKQGGAEGKFCSAEACLFFVAVY